MEKRETTTQNHIPAEANRTLALVHALNRTISLQQNLVNILNEEYAHMTALDVKGMAEAAQAKEVLLSEILDAEKQRIAATESLGTSLGIPAAEATLLRLSKEVAAPWSKQLIDARTTLMLLVERVKEFNSRNSVFAEESLCHIEEMKRNVLGINNTGTKENYSNSGMRQPILEHGGRLLDSKA